MGERPGPGGSILRGVFTAGCCLFFLGLATGAVVAKADGPPYSPPLDLAVEPLSPENQANCPSDELEPFEGEDAAAGEIRLLRAEAIQSCAAVTDRLDRLRERLWWTVAESLAASQQRHITNEKLTSLLDQDCSNPCSVYIEGQAKPVEIEAGGSLPVDDGGSSEAIVSAVDASGEAGKVALWFIAGLLVAGVVAYIMIRTVDRGT
jgi:hypothetical protein